MRRTTTVAALGMAALSLLRPGSAQALGDTVWIACRTGNGLCLKDFDDVTATLQAEGADVVVTTELTADIASGDVRLVIVALPNEDWDTPTRTMYVPGFLSQGGRLVLLGDNATETATNARIRDLLSSVPEHDLALNEDNLNPNGTCNDAPTSLIGADPLTEGVTSWHLAQTNTVSGGTALVNFTRSDGGGTATLAAVARIPSGGEVVLFGDTEGFIDSCGTLGYDIAAANAPLWRNLFNVPVGLTVDNDGDTYASDVDCDDTSAAVHPGADEECNGVDDDCDGELDEGCEDDDDTKGDDDTVGDDDAGGDDDTFAADDDDTVRDDEWGTSCDCGSSAGPVSGMLVVLPLIIRRRRAPPEPRCSRLH